MYYKKIVAGESIIEFHNNWLGEETVIVGGQIVSQKSSFLGTHHHFTVLENGEKQRYVLTTKTNGFHLFFDLRKNGVMLHEDVIISMSSKPDDKLKKGALKKLNDYDLEEALTDFSKALDLSPKDSEIYFHMACAYSVLENIEKAFECVQKSVLYGIPDQEMILKHPMLAYLRMHPAFESFYESGFKIFNL